MSGLLADVYSYIDTKKRQLKGLLADPAETIAQGVRNFGEDQRGLLALQSQAYPWTSVGSEPVSSDPARIEAARRELADKAAQMGMAAMTSPVSYRGQHTAPMKDGGAPLHDLTQIYPDDIYSSRAAQYYGHYGDGDPADQMAVSLMQRARNRPDMLVTMYRAVPYEKTAAQQIAEIDKQMAQYMKRGDIPAGSYLKGSDWYDNALRQKDKLLSLVEQQKPDALKINNGDWVTLSRAYAKEHGEGALNGKYKILSQKVPARKLFTDGNSIHEFGYDESGKITPEMLQLLAGGGLLGVGSYGALKD